MHSLQVQIVTWNSVQYLERLFKGIDNQDLDVKTLVSFDAKFERIKSNI